MSKYRVKLDPFDKFQSIEYLTENGWTLEEIASRYEDSFYDLISKTINLENFENKVISGDCEGVIWVVKCGCSNLEQKHNLDYSIHVKKYHELTEEEQDKKAIEEMQCNIEYYPEFENNVKKDPYFWINSLNDLKDTNSEIQYLNDFRGTLFPELIIHDYNSKKFTYEVYDEEVCDKEYEESNPGNDNFYSLLKTDWTDSYDYYDSIAHLRVNKWNLQEIAKKYKEAFIKLIDEQNLYLNFIENIYLNKYKNDFEINVICSCANNKHFISPKLYLKSELFMSEKEKAIFQECKTKTIIWKFVGSTEKENEPSFWASLFESLINKDNIQYIEIKDKKVFPTLKRISKYKNKVLFPNLSYEPSTKWERRIKLHSENND